MTRHLTHGDHYRALYKTIWRLNNRHDFRLTKPAANDLLTGPPGPLVA